MLAHAPVRRWIKCHAGRRGIAAVAAAAMAQQQQQQQQKPAGPQHSQLLAQALRHYHVQGMAGHTLYVEEAGHGGGGWRRQGTCGACLASE